MPDFSDCGDTYVCVASEERYQVTDVQVLSPTGVQVIAVVASCAFTLARPLVLFRQSFPIGRGFRQGEAFLVAPGG